MLILVVLFSLVWVLLCTFLYKNLRTKPEILLALIILFALPAALLGFALQSTPLLILIVGTVAFVLAFMSFPTLPSTWWFGFLLTTLTGVGLFIGNLSAKSYYDRIAETQAEFPLEKLSDRLPAPSPFVLTSAPVRNVEPPPQLDGKYQLRQLGLKLLHDDQLTHFINSPGFGNNRMPHLHMFRFSKYAPPGRPVIPIKLDSGQYQIFEGITNARLKDYHEQGVSDFVNPEGYGWVKEKQAVAGFHEHQFSQRPSIQWDGVSERRDRWNIVQLQLVSLMKHDPPMVYQSANLPRMGELKDCAVRPLTSFESNGLASLHSGESPTIYTLRNDRIVNMLGAIRTRKDCTDCHHVPEGTLLGAFSYELQEIDSVKYVPQETIAN